MTTSTGMQSFYHAVQLSALRLLFLSFYLLSWPIVQGSEHNTSTTPRTMSVFDVTFALENYLSGAEDRLLMEYIPAGEDFTT